MPPSTREWLEANYTDSEEAIIAGAIDEDGGDEGDPDMAIAPTAPRQWSPVGRA